MDRGKWRMSDSGFHEGRHYTEYVEVVEDLKRQNELEEAEKLLLSLVAATEAESRANDWGVAPWYYEQLAIIYRQKQEQEDELSILERFSKQQHAPGTKPAKLLDRLNKVRAELASD
jgi:hypothetical protein